MVYDPAVCQGMRITVRLGSKAEVKFYGFLKKCIGQRYVVSLVEAIEGLIRSILCVDEQVDSVETEVWE